MQLAVCLALGGFRKTSLREAQLQFRKLRRNVSFAQLLLDRLHLLAQNELALTLVQLAANVGLNLRLHLQHFNLVGNQFLHDREPLVHVQLLEHGIPLLRADLKISGDEVSERRRVAQIADGCRKFLRQRLGKCDDADKPLPDLSHEGVKTRAAIHRLAQALDAPDNPGFGLFEAQQLDTPDSLQDGMHRTVRGRGHSNNRGSRAELVEVALIAVLIEDMLREHPDHLRLGRGRLAYGLDIQFVRGEERQQLLGVHYSAPARDQRHQLRDPRLSAYGRSAACLSTCYRMLHRSCLQLECWEEGP